MKGMLGFLAVGVLVVIGLSWWYSIGMSEPGALTIPFAIGEAKGETVEMNAAVGMIMINVSPPVRKPNGVTERWTEWIDAHFKLSDESGEMVELKRNNFSKVIRENQVGSPEFYLVAKLKPGAHYKFDYMPYRAGGEVHRYEFTTGDAGQEFARVMLTRIDK